MAAIHDLLKQVQDPALRARLEAEIDRLTKNKKFGLVFEEHIPECTPLYDVPVKSGATVARNMPGKINEVYRVLKINDGIAVCCKKTDNSVEEIPVDELIAVAQFGDPIYPYLKPIDSVCNAPDSDLWHTLIEADNYHALQLLKYLYAGKVDCIYIDPPYNSRAKDWKYNNDYVDPSDSFKHSKWLSMMKKRLELAKDLLNPANSVLIVTIDEKEYLHLGCLLENLFPESDGDEKHGFWGRCKIQMISTVTNVKGSSRKGSFARSGEYIFFVMMGAASPIELPLEKDWLGNIHTTSRDSLRLANMMRFGDNGKRSRAPNCFYPIFITPDGKRFVGVGEPLKDGQDRNSVVCPDGAIAQFPIHTDGTEGCWGYSTKTLQELQQKGYLHIGQKYEYGYSIMFIQPGWQARIESGEIKIIGYGEDGFVQTDSSDYIAKYVPGDIWSIPAHNATEFGMKLLQKFIGKRFPFPKSVYAVHDAVHFFTADKPNALIIDFFAGSGTTLHAVNLLNAEDGGNRRCILVTNNEVSSDEAVNLRKRGFNPGDEEWEKLGIARYVTWPRTVCSIEGHDVNGDPLKGSYLGSDIPMSDGFAANCEYFKLGFLDKKRVSVGMQFREILPLLWLRAGAKGKRPEIEGEDIPEMLILPENGFAVLTEESLYSVFAKELAEKEGVGTVFFVTNSDSAFREMSDGIRQNDTYQLYKDYLENFMIGARRALQ